MTKLPTILPFKGAAYVACLLFLLTPILSAADYSKMSIAEIRKAAAAGDKDAQYSLGGLYEMGVEINKDVKSAKHWYRKAAEQGHYSAWVMLGDKSVPQPEVPYTPPPPPSSDLSDLKARYSDSQKKSSGKGGRDAAQRQALEAAKVKVVTKAVEKFAEREMGFNPLDAFNALDAYYRSQSSPPARKPERATKGAASNR